MAKAVNPSQHLAAGEPAVTLGDGFSITIRSNAELARAPHGFVPKIDRFRDALEAVLLFHSGGEWTQEKASAWRLRVKGDEATGRALCNHIRLLLGGLADPHPPTQDELQKGGWTRS